MPSGRFGSLHLETYIGVDYCGRGTLLPLAKPTCGSWLVARSVRYWIYWVLDMANTLWEENLHEGI